MDTHDLTGDALDGAVAHALGVEPGAAYSSDWNHGGPLIQSENIAVRPEAVGWSATIDTGRTEHVEWVGEDVAVLVVSFAPTPLEAAMRCLVKSRSTGAGLG